MADQTCRSDCNSALSGTPFQNQRVRLQAEQMAFVVKVGDISVSGAFRRREGGPCSPRIAAPLAKLGLQIRSGFFEPLIFRDSNG
jgi:hypothetical protein